MSPRSSSPAGTRTTATAPPKSSTSAATPPAPAGKPSGYDGHCRDLTAEQIAAYEAEGRTSIVRFRMPDEALTFTDLVRGELTFQPENVPDYGIVRANGAPLYTLVNPVDDALMEITHVLRGEDLLSSTPRQLALYKALIELGIAKGTPAFGHLPYVMGEGNKKLSKRDPQASLNLYRERGFLPEGLLNYLSLLGWSIAEDRDIFSVEEMVAAFDIGDVNANPARFDLKKCEHINAEHIRKLDVKTFTEACGPWLKAPFAPWAPEAFDAEQFAAIAPHAQTRVTVLSDITANVDFLFLDELYDGRGVLGQGDEGGLRRPARHGPRQAGRRRVERGRPEERRPHHAARSTASSSARPRPRSA